MPSKKSRPFPIHIASQNNATSLLDTLTKEEIDFLLNVRVLPIEMQAHLQRTAHSLATVSPFVVKPRAKLSIVCGAASKGGIHA